MSLQTIEINSVKIIFDKEKTKEHRTAMNNPCDCLDCRNYCKHVENNSELVEFLSGFGIDYNYTGEVFSWDLGNDKDSLIHHEGYYGVFGKIEGEEFDFEKFGVKIIFQKGASVLNCTPFVRQYDILSNEWGVYYAKRSTEQKIYARI